MSLRDYFDTRRGYYARESRRRDEQKVFFGRLIHLVGLAAWGKDSPFESEDDVFGPVGEVPPPPAPVPMTPEEKQAMTRRLNAALSTLT